MTPTFIDNLQSIVDIIKNVKRLDTPVLSKEQIAHIDDLENWTDSYQSPLQHLEHSLHGWVAYFIIPVFALANAGVLLSGTMDLDYSLITLLIFCLVLGNSIGITSIVLMAKKIKLIEIPRDISTQHIVGVSFLAGIGFTMAIFIASLAFFDSPKYIDSAKIGILIGSFISACIGYLVLRFAKRRKVTGLVVANITAEKPEYVNTLFTFEKHS